MRLLLVVAACFVTLSAQAGIVTRDFLVSKGINANAATNALNSYDHFQNDLGNSKFMTIVDFTKAAYEKRMYIVNMETGDMETYYVAHGINSGANWVVRISNELAKDNKDIGSLRSATGNFLTLYTKISQKTGYSLTVKGMDDDNANTFDRAIYVHGSPNMNPDWMKDHGGIMRRSEGCFSVDNEFHRHVIDTVKGGSLLYAYWTQAEMLENYAKSPEGQNGGFPKLLEGMGQWQSGEQLEYDSLQ